ncbi:MAG: phage integrase N-terminal SAM-like domain-containing protein [Candidatus Chisholmbacteria bacterium]|nr:phage integrase N-terminal SAM-like domain-containing protein [Candidatus Chisholmbacteria bacterium]
MTTDQTHRQITSADILVDFERLTQNQSQVSVTSVEKYVLSVFLKYLNQKKLSAKSKKNYLSDTRLFLKWLNSPPTKAQDFIDYALYLQTQKTPDSTFNRKLASLRHLSRCLTHHFAIESAATYLTTIPQDPFDSLLLSFKRHLKNSGYKGKTIVNYLSDLKHYLGWVQRTPEKQDGNRKTQENTSRVLPS